MPTPKTKPIRALRPVRIDGIRVLNPEYAVKGQVLWRVWYRKMTANALYWFDDDWGRARNKAWNFVGNGVCDFERYKPKSRAVLESLNLIPKKRSRK